MILLCRSKTTLLDGQLDVMRLEQKLRVPLKYRFPFFEELMWYGARHYTELLRAGGAYILVCGLMKQTLHCNTPLRAYCRDWCCLAV